MIAVRILIAAMLFAAGARAEPVQQPHSRAELVSEFSRVAPGTTTTLALRLQLEPEWHAYWKNPGDSGMATSIAWTLPAGLSAGPIQWPAPHRIDVGPITSYGYSDEVMLLTDITLPRNLGDGNVTLKAQADWLVCKDICIPASASFTLTLPVGESPARDATQNPRFEAARALMPRTAGDWQVQAARHGADIAITLMPPADARHAIDALAFVPDREGDIEDSQAQAFERTASGYRLRLKADPAAMALPRLAGVVTARPAIAGATAILVDAPIEASATPLSGAPSSTPSSTSSAALSQADMGVAVALLLAFAGGLILNLMPCVFPVLTIKVLGVLERAHGRAAVLREHGLLFAIGVLASFVAIAGVMLWLRAQGMELGWGFQLQSPVVVSILALVFLALGLNMSGVFEWGARAQALAGRVQLADERLDALASGLLATLVATPCTAPFMGAALGFAVTRPATEALLVFAAIALGMALPYTLLCLFPAALRKLPRPGRWMETLKQFLAFPLYATVVWLLWVLGQQTGIDGAARLLFAMVMLAGALWSWGRLRPSGALRPVLFVLFLVAAGWLAWPRSGQPPSQQAWAEWSDAAVERALAAGQPVFVDFTAAWCVSCQVNKRLVLHTDDVTRAFDAAGVQRLRADWTHNDPAITGALEKLGRNGVPVYALYVPGSREPTLLPEILTQGIVIAALGKLPQTPLQAQTSLPTNRSHP